MQYGTQSGGWNEDLSMLMEALEASSNPIEIAGKKLVIRSVSRLLKPNQTLLEVGCAHGYLLQELKILFPGMLLMGADIISEPLLAFHKRLPAVPLLQFDLAQCPLPDQCVDIVISRNMLEHIQDDRAAIRQMARILKPNGVVIVEIPAGPHLFDAHDKMVLHYRRYTMQSLITLLQEENFEIKEFNHIGFFLYPAFWLVKRFNQVFPPKTNSERILNEIHASRNYSIKKMFAVELLLSRWLHYPVGIRCLVTAVKKAV